MKQNRKFILVICCLFLLIFIASVMAVLSGSSGIDLKTIVHALLNPLSQGLEHDIIWKIRMPRVLMSMLVGAGLATCGAVFQGLLRNPLAEPYTLGVSGGAALGVTVATVAHLSSIFLPISAALGSLLCVVLVYIVASRKNFSNSTLILSGVVLSYLFSSLVLFLFSVSRADDVYKVILWLMGDLSSVTYANLKLCAIFVLPMLVFLLFYSKELNIMTLGDEKARYLGVESVNIKKVCFVMASVVVGACVAASGMIAFAGLIVPHIMRRFVGSDHKLLLPSSLLAGAFFMLFCDTLARTIVRPLELPVGVITGLFGGLFFLFFLLRSKEWKVF